MVLFPPRLGCHQRAVLRQLLDRLVVHPHLHFHRVRLGVLGKRDRWPGRPLGGVSLFAFVALTTVAFVLHRYDLAVFGGAMAGALLAFLWNNIYPAKFIMGDTGSMALGITIGVIAMLTNTTLLLPFFMIIPVVESISVIIQVFSKKTRKGKKVFRSAPIHHHFEALGWVESQVTMRFWIISAIFSSLGLVLFFLSRAM